MTVRMTTDEALVLVDEVRAYRANRLDPVDAEDTAARAVLLLDAARTASNDDIAGDPHEVVAALATDRLTYRHRMRWFATLIEAVADADRFIAWKRRTAGQHHEASAALDECISTCADRAALAVGVLLYGASQDVAA
jgi:hypothetical protein